MDCFADSEVFTCAFNRRALSLAWSETKELR